MFKRTRLMAIAGLAAVLSCCQGTAADQKTEKAETTQQQTADIQIDMNKLSEAFGNFIGKNLQMPGVKFDLESIIKGIRDGAAGKPSPLSEKEYEEMMAAVQEKAFKEMANKNLQAANEFLTKNSKESSVKELIPGKLQFVVVQEGNGAVVVEHSSPMIHYTGKYLDGTVFGTSEEMGGPITVPLDQTIPGFSKAVVGMKEGEKRKIYVHPDLGYGTTGQLPPNELLVFDVEVVKANTASDAEGKNASDKNGTDSEDNEDYDDYEDEDAQTPSKQPAASSQNKK